jgi:cytoskeletal protein CcmA (bactofilin family)
MFELGKKDSEAAQAAARQADSAGQSAAGTSAKRSGSGQFAVIGRSIQINGDVKGDEDLMIEGDVSGTVELRNHSLTVGKEGKVKANIFARAITVDGTTEGDMFASERIAVRSTANVRGNLVAPRVSLEDGARFKGSIEMDQQAVDKVIGSSSKAVPRVEPAAPRPNGDVKASVDRPGTAAVTR